MARTCSTGTFTFTAVQRRCRATCPKLIELLFNGAISPGKVFDLRQPRDQVAEGCRAMARAPCDRDAAASVIDGQDYAEQEPALTSPSFEDAEEQDIAVGVLELEAPQAVMRVLERHREADASRRKVYRHQRLNEDVIRPESISNVAHGARDWRGAHKAALTRGSHDAAARLRA
jgi:hypothetical protein